jgi:2-polyprenyl-3-methyl-5-hydroxy-6-metoxy-1,4-benzoquinol methylase
MVTLDPESHEMAALSSLAGDLSAKHVLEVGCGDGRLTRRYAGQTARVLAIDPDAAAIVDARAQLDAGLEPRVEFRTTGIADLDAGAGPFDLVIMSWSL